MSTPQEQFTDALRTSQEALAGALDTWTKAASQAFGLVPNAPFAPPVSPGQVIDQVFDFAVRLLESQRQFAKSLAETSAQVSDTLRQQAESTADKAAESVRRSTTK